MITRQRAGHTPEGLPRWVIRDSGRYLGVIWSTWQTHAGGDRDWHCDQFPRDVYETFTAVVADLTGDAVAPFHQPMG